MNKRESIYNFYKEVFEEEGRPPTLREVSLREDITRERARQLIDKLIRDGRLVDFSHYYYKSQKMLIPVELLQPAFIEKHYKVNKK